MKMSIENAPPSGLLLVAIVEMGSDVEAGQGYEDAVLGLLGRHGGVLERRMRDAVSGTEIHVIRFSSRAGYEAVMIDPERLALRAAVGDAAPRTRVVEVHDVAL